MKKALFSIGLALIICLSLVSNAFAADSDFIVQDVEVDGKRFSNVLIAYNGPGGDVVIPEGVRYVGLGIGWEGAYGSIFAGRTDITSVIIPEGVVAIGTNAFKGCTGLSSVTIPNSTKEILNSAFCGCINLTSVTIPGNVQKISTDAFYGCTGLTNLTICEGVDNIGLGAFERCTSLTNVKIPSGATVREGAFKDCENLQNITIPENIQIDGNPFDGTAWREKQGDWLIVNDTLLEYTGNNLDVVIPDGVKILGSYWYQGDWDELRSITMPDGVTKIGAHAFSGGFSGPWGFIHTVELPDSVTEIGTGAFSYSYLESLIIPDEVTTIGNGAFSDCQYLTNITIPESVTKIDPIEGGVSAFSGSDNVVIHGKAGSYTERYAKEHGIPFVGDVFSNVGGFHDVKENDFFASSVAWAVKENITAGTGAKTFSPNAACTTSQILTFLWRANGSPAPAINNPFSDVTAEDYYVDAAVWAYEKGLVSGLVFNGDVPATRAATVTYLWKLAGSLSNSNSTFVDVASTADYSQAVAWAVEEGITSGTSSTTFSPDDICTRGQVVTFLHRAFSK